MKKKYKNNNRRRLALSSSKGYTIIETMIAISLFLIVVSMGMVTLLNANLAQQKSQDVRGEVDNLSFIIDDMSRNLRTGSTYHCAIGNDVVTSDGNIPESSPNGANCWGIVFEPAKGDPANLNDQWIYYISNGHIFKVSQNFLDFNNNIVQMTPDNVVIDAVSGFSVIGAETASSGDKQQPFVKIRLVGTINTQGVITPFSLETAASQRDIDI